MKPSSPFLLFLTTLAAIIVLTNCLVAGGSDPAQLAQLRATGKCVNCDLRDAEIGGVTATDLRNSDLRGAMLYKAILKNADLTGALFAQADLKGADLRDARGANLEGAITDERTICPSGWHGPCQ